MFALRKLSALCCAVLLGIAVLGPTTGQAQTEPVTLKDVITRVLDTNANIRSQRFALNAAEARVGQAALRPAIEVGIEAENILGTNRLSTFDDAEITLRLSTVLELGGKRDSRIQSARMERSLVAVQQDAAKLDILAEAARRFIRVAQLQEDVNLTKRRLDLAVRTRKAVDERVNAARSPKLEARNAAIAADRAQIEYSGAISDLTQARGQLVALWSGDVTAAPEVTADLFAMPSAADYGALAQMIDHNPDILRFVSERRLQDTKLRLAEAQRTPDLTVSAGFRRLQADRSNALVLSASVPFGSGARAAPYIAEARELQSGAQYHEQAARTELLATLFVAVEQLRQSRGEVTTLLSSSVPSAAEAVRLADEGYQVGRFSLLELTTAQEQLTALQREAIQAAAAYHTALLEIERLTGHSAAERDNSNTPGSP
jgi:cobalt-zinc-cadmium efflux system outer membrane protein